MVLNVGPRLGVAAVLKVHPNKCQTVYCAVGRFLPRTPMVAVFEISLNINKKASSSIPKNPNYPQMTFFFYKVLIINVLCFKV